MNSGATFYQGVSAPKLSRRSGSSCRTNDRSPSMPAAWVRRIKLFAVASLLGVGLVLCSSMSQAKSAVQPLSTSSNIKRTENGTPIRWGAAELVLTLDSSLDKMGPNAKQAVRAALGTWLAGDAEMPKVTLSDETGPAGKAAEDGVNRVLAGSIDVPGHKRDLAITITYSSEKTGAILEVDIIFNTSYRYGAADPTTGDEGAAYEPKSGAKQSTDCDGAYDLQNIATHEFGHFLGLGENLGDVDATMFIKSGPCETNKRHLHAVDIAAIQELYAGFGAEEAPAGGCSVARAGASMPASSNSYGLFLTVLAAASLLRKRS